MSASRKPKIAGEAGNQPSRAPSSNLAVLTRQLHEALPGTGHEAGLDGWRRYRDALVAEVTRAVALGKLDVPAEQHRRMSVFLEYVEDHLDGEGDARAAAVALRELIVILEVQAHTLEIPRMEQMLEHPTALQRRVLAALCKADAPLDATRVCARLPPVDAPATRAAGRPQREEGPTRERVYQVLEDLRKLGLVVRSDFPGPNGRLTAHYRLWGTGRELCERVGITPEVAQSDERGPVGLVIQLAPAELTALALDPATPGRDLLVKQVLSILRVETALRVAFRVCVAQFDAGELRAVDGLGRQVEAHVRRLATPPLQEPSRGA